MIDNRSMNVLVEHNKGWLPSMSVVDSPESRVIFGGRHMPFFSGYFIHWSEMNKKSSAAFLPRPVILVDSVRDILHSPESYCLN